MSDTFVPLSVPQPQPPTMKIVSEDTENGFIVINVADFDAATMKPFDAPKRGRAASAE